MPIFPLVRRLERRRHLGEFCVATFADGPSRRSPAFR
jgi:hypothetical protein